MKLKSISATNFKGRSFSHELAPVTIFTGDNARGKTSRLDAIQLALCGYHPRLPKTNVGIMSLASGSSMSVTAELDDTMLHRCWQQTKATIKRVESKDCAGFEVPSVLIDPDSYFTLSDRERVKYVFGLVQVEAVKSLVDDICAGIKNHKFETNTAETEQALVKIATHVRNWQIPDTAQDRTTQTWLETLLTNLKVEKSTLLANINRMSSTVQGVTQLASEVLVDPTPQKAAAQKKLEQLLVQQRDLSNALVKAQEVLKQREKIQQQILVLKSTVNPTNLPNEIQELKDLIADYVCQIPQLETELRAAREAVNTLTEAMNNTQQHLTIGQRVVEQRTELERQLAEAQQESLGLPELEAELKQKQERIQVLAKSSRIVEKDVASLRAAVGRLQAHGASDEAGDLLDMIQNNAIEVIDTTKLTEQITGKRLVSKTAEVLSRQIAALPPLPDIKSYETHLATCRTQHQELAAKVTDTEQRLASARKQDQCNSTNRLTLAQKEAELQRLNDAPRRVAELEQQLEAVPVIEVTNNNAQIQSDLDACRRDIGQLEQKYKMFIAQKSEAATKQKAVQQRLLMEAEFEVVKVAIAICDVQQQSMVENAFVEILRVANEACGGVLKAPLQYRDGEIGMMAPVDGVGNPVNAVQHQWVTHRTMSGSEQMVTYAALAVSLAAQSPIRILLLDEVQRIDAEHSLKLMTNLCYMIETGMLDQVVMAGLVSPLLPEAVNGSELVKVVTL